MKTFVDNVSNPEFYSKHAGKRFPAVAMRLLFQCFSLLTASIGAYHVFPIENQAFRLAAALMFAFSAELAVLFFGYSAILPWAEKIGGKKAYDVESDAANIDKYVNRASKFLFYGPLVCSAILTLIGAFSIGQAVKDAGPKPVLETFIDTARQEVAAKQIYAGDPRIKELSALSTAIDQKADYIANQDSINARARDDFNQSQAAGKPVWGLYHSSKEWFEKTSIAEKADLKEMQRRLSTLSDALAGLNDKMEMEIASIAERRHNGALSEWQRKNDSAGWNGRLFLLFGVVAQAGVFALFFFIVMVDIGTGQITRRQASAFDRVNLIGQRWEILADRFRQTLYVSNVNLSERPLKIQYRPGEAMPGRMLRGEVEKLRIYKPAPFDLYGNSTPTLPNDDTEDLQDFEEILSSVYGDPDSGLNGHDKPGLSKQPEGKLEKHVNKLLGLLEFMDLTKIGDVDNFRLFRYDPTGFYHVNRRTGKGKWKDLTAVSNSASTYAGRVKKTRENLSSIGDTGNGLIQKGIQDTLKHQTEVLSYWYSAKSILEMIRDGELSREDVDRINERAKESFFEKTH